MKQDIDYGFLTAAANVAYRIVMDRAHHSDDTVQLIMRLMLGEFLKEYCGSVVDVRSGFLGHALRSSPYKGGTTLFTSIVGSENLRIRRA